MIGIWIVAGAVLTAADFWEEKDFTVWSDKEVEKILTDSPWSQKVSIVLRIRGGGNGGGRNGGRNAGLGAVGDPSRSRPRGRDGFVEAARRENLTISWRSALPVKQALVRNQIGIDAKISFDQQKFLDQSESFYIMSVSGFTPRLSRLVRRAARRERSTLLAETLLKRKGHDAIVANDVQLYMENNEVVVVEYLFHKTNEIAINDKDVEFITRVGEDQIKKKFELKDMVFDGELTL